MQLCNVMVRLGGSLLHTVPVTRATPAEILVLQSVHGDDAVTDVRPGKNDHSISHADEYERLANKYDGSASASAPGDDDKSTMRRLFPGAVKKLPETLSDIGMGHLDTKVAKAAVRRRARSGAAPDEGTETELVTPDPDDDQTGAEDGTGEGNLAEAE